MVGQDGVQHGHEVALAGAERAVQVGGVRGVRAHRLANDRQCLAERLLQLIGYDVLVHALGDVVEATGELDLERAGEHCLGQVQHVPQILLAVVAHQFPR